MIKADITNTEILEISKDIEQISVAQDKSSFYKEIIQYVSRIRQDSTVLVYLLNEDGSQAALVAEGNLFSENLKKFVTIDNSHYTIWSPIKENRVKLFRNLITNESVNSYIKGLGKSSAIGVPVIDEDDEVIGAIWVLDNSSKTTAEYVLLKDLLLEAAEKIAWKELHDSGKKGHN